MKQDKRWNKKKVLINDYVDIEDAVLSAQDILKIASLHDELIEKLGTGKWYFITNRIIHYGILRMYSLYINDTSNPQIFVYKHIRDIKDDQIRQFAYECREDCRIFEIFTKEKK